MNNTNNNTSQLKRSRGRPHKQSAADAPIKNTDSGIPALLEPNVHDINDELIRMDSFAYSRYNE